MSKYQISDESYFSGCIQGIKKPEDDLVPSWFKDRPCISDDFIKLNLSFEKIEEDTSFLKGLSISEQEALIVDDLLYLLMGIDGKFITIYEDKETGLPRYNVDSHFHDSLKQLINYILPVCAGYVEVSKFADEYQMYTKGMVGNALAAAISSLLQDYLIHVSQLEFQAKEGHLSLQKLWYYIQGSLDLMNVLRELTHDIRSSNVYGGGLLNLIYSKALRHAGDKITTELYNFILKQGSDPYFEFLRSWIYRGTLVDPYAEFFVQEDDYIVKDSANKFSEEYFWKKKYMQIPGNIFKIIEPVSERIFMTGKYINAIRECGVAMSTITIEDFNFTHNERDICEHIERAYTFASAKLLDTLIKGNDLMKILHSVKKFFFMEHGDFFNHFMDLAEEEMKQLISKVSIETLKVFFDEAMRVTSAKENPFNDRLLIKLVENNLIDDLLIHHKRKNIESVKNSISGLEGFSIDWKVKWPIVLVLSRNTLNSYQYLFRHLFYIRYTEKRLTRTWVLHQTLKRLLVYDRNPTQKHRLIVRSFSLRHRMTHLLQALQHYMMVDTIEPEFRNMEAKIMESKTVEELLEHHNNFLEICSRNCLLTEIEAVSVLTKLLSTCVIFSNYSERFVAQIAPEVTASGKERMLMNKISTEVGSQSLGFMEETIKEFENNFDTQYKGLLEITSKDPASSKLNINLDFNDFYT